MPRKPRMYLGGLPYHVITRGNNREACFFANQDYQFYLDCLSQACRRYRVKVHAYVLMTNHVHLLMTPNDEFGVSRVMQSLGRRYVQYVNNAYHRYGTLWQSRHKASLIGTEDYLLACYRYIELNPVRAGMVTHPGEYRWSSYHSNACGKLDSLITPHECYEGLAIDPSLRKSNYRVLFDNDLDTRMAHQISRASEFSSVLGSGRYSKQLEDALGRTFGRLKRGRPRKRE